MAKPSIAFKVNARDGAARQATLYTRRGEIETPVFMPIGTAGTVKGVRFEQLESTDLDARIILGNTYHLLLRPGLEVVRSCGGLHRFISWERPILTDSGGFQVWSLGELRKLTEEGVEFRSHLDGSSHLISPEISMEIQATLGSEIVMAFDECASCNATHEETRASMELTARWAQRSLKRFKELQNDAADLGRLDPTSEVSGEQALFGIVQGASDVDLRRESLAHTVEIGFDGYAIGGLSVGEEKPVMWGIIDEIVPLMPYDRPRYLMGVGTPEDLVEAVARGVDMFDCVLPTRNGRTGQAFTSKGKVNVKNARWATDTDPLDENCGCQVCRRHSRAYLRHLYVSGEMLASILLTHHNLAFFLDTMKGVRQAIRSGEFTNFRRKFTESLNASDESN
jgi:queuine tRNA-ribosyltransferase